MVRAIRRTTVPGPGTGLNLWSNPRTTLSLSHSRKGLSAVAGRLPDRPAGTGAPGGQSVRSKSCDDRDRVGVDLVPDDLADDPSGGAQIALRPGCQLQPGGGAAHLHLGDLGLHG